MLKWSALRVPAGFVLLGVGAVGIFLPILPTTPFVLLATACFSCNPRLHGWLNRNPFFRDYMTNYKERNGLRPMNIVISLAFLWVTLCVSMLAISTVWSIYLLCAVGIAVSIHILCMARPGKKQSSTGA